MYPFTSQVGRLRPILLLIAAAIGSACDDNHSITSPHPDRGTPILAATTRGAADATDPDALVITITPGKTGTIGTRTGIVQLNATLTCSKAGALIRLGATLNQYDRRTGTGVAGSGEIEVACTTSPLLSYIPVIMAPINPDPQPGKADVLFQVLTSGVIAPSVQRSVRLVAEIGS